MNGYILQFTESGKYVLYRPGRTSRRSRRALSPFVRVATVREATTFPSINRVAEAIEQRGRHWGTKHGNGTRTSKASFRVIPVVNGVPGLA